MSDTPNIFISWSGPRSKHAAIALRRYLCQFIQRAEPWMSEKDIESGSVSIDEILTALETTKVGIVCLTPENLTAPWLNFEAGALLKTPDAKARVCTYLLAGLEPRSLKKPLEMFQATRAEKEPTRKLIRDINKYLDGKRLSEAEQDTAFDKWWPDLEKELNALPPPTGIVPPLPDTKEMVAEILEHVRGMRPEIQEINRETASTRARREAEERFSEFARSNPNAVFATTLAPPVSGGFSGLGSRAVALYGAASGKLSDMLSVPGTNETAIPPPATQSAETRGHLPSSPARKKHLAPSRRGKNTGPTST